MRRFATITTMFLSIIFLLSTSFAQPQPKGLKDYYKDYFSIGVAVAPVSLQGKEATLIKKEFNSITPENAMKMESIHPEENRYNWKDADSIVDFAVKNHIKIRGHNLCWHEQVPLWMFVDDKGDTVSKTVLLQRLKDHIYTVVKRYKGKIYAWDVVNEVIDDNPDNFLRNSAWYRICGEDFIIKAFEYAHEADQKAILFYNDYNTERPEKRERVYKLLKHLKEKSVPVNGVGLQAHWSVYEPQKDELEATINRFASLGLQVQITELDISVYRWEKEKRNLMTGENKGYTTAMEVQQTKQYKMVFDVFRKYKNAITGVTFWNISDHTTWLDHYPVEGRKNFPLLFDENLQRKQAYNAVINF